MLPASFSLLTLQEAGIDREIPEPHDTLEANAREKSMTIFGLTGLSCFSEDTGLEVASLGNAPGVRSARYAGDNATAKENIDKLLLSLHDHSDRRARFRTVISLIMDGVETNFEGICEGTISTVATGQQGFGYDPVFVPLGASVCFAEMDAKEKNRYSHRRKAMDQLIDFLLTQKIP